MNSEERAEENSHVAWLCVVAFFNGGTLNGANLSFLNFTGANLTGANLTGANFTGANLSGANFTGADLTGADFSGAILTGANLLGTRIVGTNFIAAKLFAAKLHELELEFKLDLDESIDFFFEVENKRDCLLTSEIHQFKNWYIVRSSKCITFHFEDEVDAIMAKILIQ